MYGTFLNLTQHPASEDQARDGLIDLTGEVRASLLGALTFTSLPTGDVIAEAAAKIVAIAKALNADYAMIGGAGFLLPELERQLLAECIFPLQAFTARVVEETISPTGEMVKTSVFRHAGWIRTPGVLAATADY